VPLQRFTAISGGVISNVGANEDTVPDERQVVLKAIIEADASIIATPVCTVINY
jgi:hypothetical protein